MSPPGPEPIQMGAFEISEELIQASTVDTSRFENSSCPPGRLQNSSTHRKEVVHFVPKKQKKTETIQKMESRPFS